MSQSDSNSETDGLFDSGRAKAHQTGNFGHLTTQNPLDISDYNGDGDKSLILGRQDQGVSREAMEREDQRAMRRWGRVINMQSYTPGSVTRLLSLVTAILLIPLQLFCDGFVKEKEQSLIIDYQSKSNIAANCAEDGTICKVMSIPHFMLETSSTVQILFALLLFADSWLAYKTTLVTCLGIYALAFLQLSFKSGRPFWDVFNITSNGHCLFDFGGPSQSSFIMTFFWPYIILMFLYKYYKSPNCLLNWIALIVLLVIWVDIYFYCYANGLDYLYQLILGQLVGFCYLVACLVFDTEMHRYTLRTGFSMRSSRARKFYLFFFLLGLLVAFLVYYFSLYGVWIMPQNWIVNAYEEEDSCQEDFRENANNTLGLNQTMDKSAIIFVVIGMIFGWPYALHHFSALQWINTTVWKRLLRMVLGVAITVGVQLFFDWAISDTNDLATKYFFGKAVPYFLNSFFVFGLFPIACKWLHLVQKEEHFQVQFEGLARSQMLTNSMLKSSQADLSPKAAVRTSQTQLVSPRRDPKKKADLTTESSEDPFDLVTKSAGFGGLKSTDQSAAERGRSRSDSNGTREIKGKESQSPNLGISLHIRDEDSSKDP